MTTLDQLLLLIVAVDCIYLMHCRRSESFRLLGVGGALLGYVVVAAQPRPRHLPDPALGELALAVGMGIALAIAWLYALYTLFDVFGDELIDARGRERAGRRRG